MDGPPAHDPAAGAHSSVHPPLEEGSDCIRLLRVHAATEDHVVECTSHVVQLDQRPAYTAISYAWGSVSGDCSVVLNGHAIKAGKNLLRLLSQVRSSEHGRFSSIWVDALCIDQANNEERSQQVALMGKIFSQAERVVAWLGPSYGSSDEAMREISQPSTYWNRKRSLKVWTTARGTAIRGVLTRHYWRRLWIFQELALATRIELMCGDRIIPFEPFRQFLLRLDSYKPPVHVTSGFEYETVQKSSAMAIVRQISNGPIQAPLMDLMQMTRESQCSEPRDRVYALLTVAKETKAQIRADYDIPISTLLNSVLRDQHESQPSDSLEQVADQCQQLAKLMGVPLSEVFKCSPETPSSHQQQTQHCEYQVGPTGSGITLAWTMFWHHHIVRRLLYRDKFVDEWKLLEQAVEQGHELVVRLLLDPRAPWPQDELLPLSLAPMYGHFLVVNVLLEYGFDMGLWRPGYYRSSEYISALDDALSNGHTAVVDSLLAIRAEYRSEEDFLEKSMTSALAQDCLGVVKLLVERGADPNSICPAGSSPNGRETALSAAAAGGQKDLVEFLLQKGADINLKGGYYGYALQAASRYGDAGIVKTLLYNGADVNLEGGGYGYALHAASCLGESVEIVKMLLDNSADVNAKGRPYGYALHAASSGGNAEIVEMLLAKGADVNAKGGGYGYALHAASDSGHVEIVKMLLVKGAEITAQSDYHGSPLMAAAAGETEGCLEVISLLLERGIDVNAIGGGHYDYALHSAVSAYDGKAAVELLLDKGADVHARHHEAGTALQLAATCGKWEVAKLLLERGADVNARAGVYGQSALHGAVMNARPMGAIVDAHSDYKQVDRLLLERDADANARERPDDDSALMIALKTGNDEAVHLLSQYGANADDVEIYEVLPGVLRQETLRLLLEMRKHKPLRRNSCECWFPRHFEQAGEFEPTYLDMIDGQSV